MCTWVHLVHYAFSSHQSGPRWYTVILHQFPCLHSYTLCTLCANSADTTMFLPKCSTRWVRNFDFVSRYARERWGRGTHGAGHRFGIMWSCSGINPKTYPAAVHKLCTLWVSALFALSEFVWVTWVISTYQVRWWSVHLIYDPGNCESLTWGVSAQVPEFRAEAWVEQCDLIVTSPTSVFLLLSSLGLE